MDPAALPDIAFFDTEAQHLDWFDAWHNYLEVNNPTELPDKTTEEYERIS